MGPHEHKAAFLQAFEQSYREAIRRLDERIALMILGDPDDLTGVRPAARVVCECGDGGAESAAHSTWCPKFRPFKVPPTDPPTYQTISDAAPKYLLGDRGFVVEGRCTVTCREGRHRCRKNAHWANRDDPHKFDCDW